MPARIFLYAPPDLAPAELRACVIEACAVGDCASVIVHDNVTPQDVAALQALGLAVLLADADAPMVKRLKADGLHISRAETDLSDLRQSLPKGAIIGCDCGTSRHAAMQAAEQGADYIGFRQKAQSGGEPLVKWWNDLAAIPAVPLDAASAAEAALLAQQGDFIRPLDEMWHNPAAARRVIAELNEKLK